MKKTVLPASALVIVLVATGCVAPQPMPSGAVPKQLDTNVAGPVSGIGIENQDIVAMTDQMMRDILASPVLASRPVAPRVVIDSKYFRNQGSQAINRDLITQRLSISLMRSSAGRITFVTRANVKMVQEERDLKEHGVVDAGTASAGADISGADYRLQGAISTLDSRSARTGLMQRFNQISFELVDLQTGQIVWGNIYEFARSAADDVVYR